MAELVDYPDEFAPGPGEELENVSDAWPGSPRVKLRRPSPHLKTKGRASLMGPLQ